MLTPLQLQPLCVLLLPVASPYRFVPVHWVVQETSCSLLIPCSKCCMIFDKIKHKLHNDSGSDLAIWTMNTLKCMQKYINGHPCTHTSTYIQHCINTKVHTNTSVTIGNNCRSPLKQRQASHSADGCKLIDNIPPAVA